MKLFTETFKFVEEHQRMLLTGIAVGGTLLSGYFWYKAGCKASKVIDEKKEEIKLCDQNDSKAIKTVKTEMFLETAPLFILPMATTGLTVGSIIFNYKVTTKDILLLSSAYTMTRDRLKDKEIKMNEILGEKKVKEIDGSIMQEHIDADKGKPPQVFVTKYGDTLCKDYYTGRYFTSSPMRIQQAILELSNRLQNEMWVPLNELYYLLNLDPVPLGNDLGFNVEHSIKGQIPIVASAVLNEYNQPCYCVEYDVDIRQRYLLETR